jgi:hypothetical protein
VSKRIDIYSNRGQGCFLVLYAVRDLGGIPASRETLDNIVRNGWYKIRADDLPPYDRQTEPAYHTLLRWARKDSVEFGLIANDHWDEWALTRKGSVKLDEILGGFREKKFSVHKCYLWTQEFKRLVDPTYVPSPEDAIRPKPKPRHAENRKFWDELARELSQDRKE